MSKLAINGGKPAVMAPLAPYNSIGDEEKRAAMTVLDSGCLSRFIGAWGDDFLGGPAVKSFEEAWAKSFNVQHAVSVNSATSGLFAAVGAVGLGPGDEVIVPPYTMSATVMAPLLYGGIPVFADIDPETFCIDVEAVRGQITRRTRAIIAVNLFGHPAKLSQLRALADESGIKLIEDNAQGPLATENGRYAGTIGHIGVFSLNYHKHIHTGEGGVCVTDDDELALKLQLIRNHGENVVEHVGLQDITNIIGFNYRMTELSAAVGMQQLKKIDEHVGRREEVAAILTRGVSSLPGMIPPVVRPGCRHVYYVWALRYDRSKLGVSREVFVRALAAEGFPTTCGYVRPLYLLPIFQKRVAIGTAGFPFSLSDRSYPEGLCATAERMHREELILFHICSYDINAPLAHQLVEAINKVYAARDELSEASQKVGAADATSRR